MCSGASAAALLLALSLLAYWRRRAVKLRKERATRSRSWGAKAAAQIATSARGSELQRLVLREEDVIIAVDAAGRPCSLGSGAHGQVQPSRHT